MATRTPTYRDTTDGTYADLPAGDLVAPAAGGVPTGAVMDFGGSAPSGWLECDGAAVSRTTYVALYAYLGTTWGAGDGSTTFNLPDCRGRARIGAGTGTSLTARTLAATVGAETHTLDVSQMPSHGHDSTLVGGGGSGANVTTGGGGYALRATANTGGGGSHNNMQPSIVLRTCIKT